MNTEIKEFYEQIKNRLKELDMNEFVFFSADYFAEWADDEDYIWEDIINEMDGIHSHRLECYISSRWNDDHYHGDFIFVRRIYLIDEELYFDLEIVSVLSYDPDEIESELQASASKLSLVELINYEGMWPIGGISEEKVLRCFKEGLLPSLYAENLVELNQRLVKK